LPNAALILDSVQEFGRSIEPEADYLENCYLTICAQMDSDVDGGGETGEDAVHLYQIKVHSMKSSAALVGAVGLYGVASVLESAAREGNLETIRKVTPVFLREWRSYKNRLEAVAQTEEKTRVALEDCAILLAYLEIIRHAMDDFDIDILDDTMAELKQYHYPEAIDENVRQLDTAVTNLDSEQVNELVSSIMWQINLLEEEN
jgi:HPt (histidine-containing phosphotransfer) domain-containing protein